MIIFLYGKDTYRNKESLQKMIEKFRVERDPQGLNLTQIDCETTKENILQQVLAAPFLAEKRMVVLSGLLSSKQKEVQEALLTRIEEKTLPSDVILIIAESIEKPKTKVAKALFERLLKEQFVQYFEELSGPKLAGWILAEAKDRGGEIERDAANVLATSVGSDMWKLSGILDQLLAYTCSPPAKGELEGVRAEGETPPQSSPSQGRKISVEDVYMFVDEKVDDNIFNLVDAIVQKNTKHVFQMIQEQYRAGNDAGYIFAMIVRQYRILLELRDLYDRGENLQSSSLAKELGLHPFVIKKSLPMVKRYSKEELAKIHEQLLVLDTGTKTGKGDQAYLLDMFIGTLVV